MSVLNLWQRIDRVIPGQPWGDGVDGPVTVAANPNTSATYTGTAASTSGTAGSTAFANGDLVKCIQTQGTGVGQYEYNMVVSGGGSTSLVMQQANHYTYGTGAQIIKIPRYTTATISAHSVTAWNGTTGGVEVICAKTSITVSGVLNGNGLGYRLGTAHRNNTTAGTGEGTVGVSTLTRAANGSGGGAGENQGPGAGGGHATAGGQSTDWFYGYAGNSSGAADLTTMTFGGGGGGGASDNGGRAGDGREGGGIIVLISDSIILTAGVTSDGIQGDYGTGTGGYYYGGGGGAGGSVLIVCKTATLGTNQATALSGASNGEVVSGAGSVGRIAVHHSGTVTGTTNPTFTDINDPSLIGLTAGFFNLF